MQNLFAHIPDDLPDELVEVISTGEGVRIERIVSRGHASSDGIWYDQANREFVILLAGSAGLLFENEDAPRVMKPGDWMEIPSHARHRVQWTDPETDTIWLAVHY